MAHASDPHRLAALTAPRFAEAVGQLGVAFDEQQRAAINQLTTSPTYGLYLWGDVGRGKSLLADLYFDAIPTERKRRLHFHSFFRALERQITSHRQSIERSIDNVIDSAQAVLFDEFHVHDVADAVFLTKTLRTVLDQGILVIATSNYEPEALMPNPLFHERFVPTIALINEHLSVVHVGAGPDYRGLDASPSAGFRAGSWYITHPDASVRATAEVIVNGFRIPAVEIAQDTVTLTFADLCGRPIGTRECLRLAEDFRGIRLLNVPDLAHADRDSILRLCNLIDVMYDRDQPLDVVATASPQRMLQASHPPHDAARTLSRIAPLVRAQPNPA